MYVGKWLAVTAAVGIATVSCSAQDSCDEPVTLYETDAVIPTISPVPTADASSTGPSWNAETSLANTSPPSYWPAETLSTEDVQDVQKTSQSPSSTASPQTAPRAPYSTTSTDTVPEATQSLGAGAETTITAETSPSISVSVPSLTVSGPRVDHSALALCQPHNTFCPGSDNGTSTTPPTTTSSGVVTLTRSSTLHTTLTKTPGVTHPMGTALASAQSSAAPSRQARMARRSCGGGQVAATASAPGGGDAATTSGATVKAGAKSATGSGGATSASKPTGTGKSTAVSASSTSTSTAHHSGSGRTLGWDASRLLLFGLSSAVVACLLY